LSVLIEVRKVVFRGHLTFDVLNVSTSQRTNFDQSWRYWW